MRERFLIHGSRSPFNWALRLRAHGKQVRNTTTCLGHIRWLEDGETISYKQTRFSLQGLRDLVRHQVQQAQQILKESLLIEPGGNRHEDVPFIAVGRLSDGPTRDDRGWTFLKDPLNRDELPTGHARWLLDRIMAKIVCGDDSSRYGPTKPSTGFPKLRRLTSTASTTLWNI